MKLKCSSCVFGDLCHKSQPCEFYCAIPILEGSEEDILVYHKDVFNEYEDRMQFYQDWFEYISEYE